MVDAIVVMEVGNVLLETMTIAEVASAKCVSEAAVRFAVNDPRNNSLMGIKVGGRLLVLASYAQDYKPRNYPRMDSLNQIADAHQRRIRDWLEELAADMVADHPLAAKVLKSCFPCGNITHNSRPAYCPLLVLELPDDLREVERGGSPELCFIDPADNEETVRRKAREWALRIVADGWVAEEQ